jgi:predicted aspartyl protease
VVEVVKVEKRVRVHKDGKVVEVIALFDTGSRRSYFSKEFAEKIGYEPYKEPKEVPLAVRGKYGKLVGDATVYIEVEGYILPERETIGVIEDLRVDAIIGLNIMESYGIYIENNEVKFKHIPPTSMII